MSFDDNVKIETLSPGDGTNFPKSGQKVSCHYTLRLKGDDKVIDSSHSRGKPFEFVIGKGNVIRGWDEGLLKVSKGQKCRFTIQPEYGYGANGAGNVIPPNAVLEFEVEFL